MSNDLELKVVSVRGTVVVDHGSAVMIEVVPEDEDRVPDGHEDLRIFTVPKWAVEVVA